MQNLNEGVQCEDREKVHAHGTTEVWFNAIAARLGLLLGSTPYVVGAMAWFHDRTILKALRQCQGVSFLITSERGAARYHQARFGALPCFHPNEKSAVRIVGRATGRRRALMHHKFAVGLDEHKKPIWALTGSYNPTQHSKLSLENVVVLRDPAIASVYFREYERLHGISRPVRLSSKVQK